MYYSEDMAKGDALSKNKVTVKSPALEIRSRYLEFVAEAKLKKNVSKNDHIKWEDLEF